MGIVQTVQGKYLLPEKKLCVLDSSKILWLYKCRG